MTTIRVFKWMQRVGQGRYVRCAYWAGLVVTVLFGLYIRCHYKDWAFDRDISCYAVAAHEMYHGAILYSEAWDHKPPAVHVLFLMAEVLWGYNNNSIFLLGSLFVVATAMGIYRAASVGPFGARAGMVSVILYILISNNLDLNSQHPNVEVFMNASLVWVIALAVNPVRGRPWLSATIGGLFLAFATLLKQIALFPGLAVIFGAVLLLVPRKERRRGLKIIALQLCIVGIAWLLVGACFLKYLSLNDFIYAVVTYNRDHAGSIVHNIYSACRYGETITSKFPFLYWPVIYTMLGGIVGIDVGKWRPWLLLIFYLAGVYIAV